jgi:hypothetical protein
MTIELTAPASYAEMSEKELRYLATLLVAGQTEEQIRIKCFIKYAGIKLIRSNEDTYYFRRKGIKGNFTLTVDEVMYFAKKFNYLTNNHIGIKPFTKIGKYKAVDRLLRDTCFEQYLNAENYYQAYIHTSDPVHVHKLMAVLYTDKNGYNSKRIDAMAGYFARKATAEDRLITTMWMIGIKEYFLKKFRYLFVRQAVNEEEEVKLPDMLEIMTNQVRMLTGGDVTKNLDVLKANTWDALIEIDKKCEEYKKLNKDV